MKDEVLGRQNRTIKNIALNIINHSDFYTKEEVKKAYEMVTMDNRLAQKTKMNLLDGLRKVYRQK